MWVSIRDRLGSQTAGSCHPPIPVYYMVRYMYHWALIIRASFLTVFFPSQFVQGEPVVEACCRTNVGGHNITEYLKQLLSLKYPLHT